MNTMQRALLCALPVAGSLSAISCAGNSGAPAIPTTRSITQPAAKGAVTETLSVKVPLKSNQSAKRRPAFVSPATQAMNVTITPSSGGSPVVEQTVALTASSPNCSPTPNSLLCTNTFSVSPGSYVANVTLVDGNDNPLSSAQNVPFTVVANQNNAIVLTLDGIPASLSIAPLPGQTWVTGSESGGFSIQSGKTTQFSAIALDADGDAIVGPGSPAIGVSTTSANVTVVAPVATTPNTFSVTGTFSLSIGTASFTVSATPPGGSALSQSVPVRGPLQQLLVGRIAGLAADNQFITAFEPGSPAAAAVYQGNSSTVVAVDSSGNVYSALASALGNSSGIVDEYSPQNSGPTPNPNYTPPTGSAPTPPAYVAQVTSYKLDLAPDSDLGTIGTDVAGDLYVSDNGTLSEYRFGSSTPTRALAGWESGGAGSPLSIAFDAGGDVAGIDPNGLVQEFTAGSTSPERSFNVTNTAPPASIFAYFDHLIIESLTQALAMDASGDLYVLAGDGTGPDGCNSSTGSFVVEYPPGTSSTPSRTLTIPSSLNPCYIQAIVTDASGNVWVAADAESLGGPSSTTLVAEFGPSGSAPIGSYTLDGTPAYLAVDMGGDQYVSVSTTTAAQVDEVLPGTTTPATTLVSSSTSDLPIALSQP
jgi:hypothetical protein